MIGDELLEQAATFALRPLAQVDAAELEDVVGDEADRCVGEYLLRQRLATDALLQQVEGSDLAVLPDDDFAVEHGAIVQRLRGRDDFVEALGDELFAARPDPG